MKTRHPEKRPSGPSAPGPPLTKRRRISSSPASNSIFATANAAAVDLGPDAFPRFHKGSVSILLSADPKFQFQFHRAVLERNSKWFSASLDAVIEEPVAGAQAKVDLPGAHGAAKLRFVLEKVERRDEPMLVRKPLVENVFGVHGPAPELIAGSTSTLGAELFPPSPKSMAEDSAIPVPSLSCHATTTGGPTTGRTPSLVKPEPDEEKGEEAGRKAEEAQQRRLEGYNNLFLTYYNMAPRIEPKDIGVALEQCETLIRLATLYDSLATVRPYLGNIFSQYRRALFVAIAADPPRWMKLAVPLQSAAIFTEAVVHLVGCYPRWPWPTQHTTVPSALLRLVAAKQAKLTTLRADADHDLFLNTIKVGDAPVTLGPAGTHYETWIVVQLFRDWLCRAMNAARDARREDSGTHYRLLRQGGDAYLPAEAQVALLKRCAGGAQPDGDIFAAWAEVRADLKLLKDYAAGVVEELCANNLMVEVAELGVEYLTCTQVHEWEFPWSGKGK
ncbi:MAG: hypothetical protein M1832_005870 [Thelocarpon impressellum]|nr:MAG: hypothetical protein M1832_005870 [Thelocarpon impressellum]